MAVAAVTMAAVTAAAEEVATVMAAVTAAVTGVAETGAPLAAAVTAAHLRRMRPQLEQRLLGVGGLEVPRVGGVTLWQKNHLVASS